METFHKFFRVFLSFSSYLGIFLIFMVFASCMIAQNGPSTSDKNDNQPATQSSQPASREMTEEEKDLARIIAKNKNSSANKDQGNSTASAAIDIKYVINPFYAKLASNWETYKPDEKTTLQNSTDAIVEQLVRQFDGKKAFLQASVSDIQKAPYKPSAFKLSYKIPEDYFTFPTMTMFTYSLAVDRKISYAAAVKKVKDLNLSPKDQNSLKICPVLSSSKYQDDEPCFNIVVDNATANSIVKKTAINIEGVIKLVKYNRNDKSLNNCFCLLVCDPSMIYSDTDKYVGVYVVIFVNPVFTINGKRIKTDYSEGDPPTDKADSASGEGANTSSAGKKDSPAGTKAIGLDLPQNKEGENKNPTASKPSDGANSSRTSNKTVDLIKMIDADNNDVSPLSRGTWSKSENSLVTSGSAKGQPPVAMVIPYQPSGEYNLKIVYTLDTAENMVISFPYGGSKSAALFMGDANNKCYILGAGKSVNANITANVEYTLLIKVRKDTIICVLNDKEIITLPLADNKPVSYQLFNRYAKNIGIAVYNTKVIFSSMTLCNVNADN